LQESAIAINLNLRCGRQHQVIPLPGVVIRLRDSPSDEVASNQFPHQKKLKKSDNFIVATDSR
jgi:hypothetical protein